ncbi:MAG: hypothetical protein ACI4TI_02310, partial [Christensenellales bacterium]
SKIQFAEKVFMTQAEYDDLLKQYGTELTKQLIEQLNLYKQAKGEKYDNDYAAILRWVTTRIREMEKEEQSYKNFKNKLQQVFISFFQKFKTFQILYKLKTKLLQ